jgi:inosine-uridine nucleoside N-ribohydrolase
MSGYGSGVPVILDTDIALDVDDAGALALLHRCADLGECEILAVGVCTSAMAPDGGYGAACVDRINRYYGRDSIPIGIYKGAYVISERVGKYASRVADSFPGTVNCADTLPEAWKLYRKTLAMQPDTSVTIVTIGFLNILSELLSSGPDEYSGLTGIELVRLKVKEWVCMGGHFPVGNEEFNVNTYALDSRYVFANWPGSVVFLGAEFGINVKTGARLGQRYSIEENPVAMCWHYYNGGQNRDSWDQLAALYAVRGTALYFELSETGIVSNEIIGSYIPGVLYTSRNVWTPCREGMHRYLLPAMRYELLAECIDELMCAAPLSKPVVVA